MWPNTARSTPYLKKSSSTGKLASLQGLAGEHKCASMGHAEGMPCVALIVRSHDMTMGP